jgi:hypothetical protein
MARGINVATNKVKVRTAAPELVKSPSVAPPGKVYNPGHSRAILDSAPRIKPMQTRIYSKEGEATGEDPSKFQNFGVPKNGI